MSMTICSQSYYIKAVFFLSLVILGSCSGRTLDARGREEIRFSKVIDTESSEKELFENAIKAYDNRQFNNASQNLEALLQNYPDGAYLEPAKLKLIDAKFYSSNYTQVVTLVDEFLEMFPDSNVAPHLLMLAGVSYSQTFGGVGRDPTPLLEAKNYFERIVKEYPDTDYYQSAQDSLDKINQTLISYQDYLVEFYRKQQLADAATVRAQKKEQLELDKKPSISRKIMAPEGVSVEQVE